jgi:hypothetical protein
MRACLHVLAVLCLLPSAVFATAFLALGHAIAAGSLFGFFEQILAAIASLIPWGLLTGLTLFLVLVAAGFSRRLRWLAALCVTVLAIVSSAVVVALDTGPPSSGQWAFFLPALLSASMGFWLAASERPRGRLARSFRHRESP